MFGFLANLILDLVLVVEVVEVVCHGGVGFGQGKIGMMAAHLVSGPDSNTATSAGSGGVTFSRNLLRTNLLTAAAPITTPHRHHSTELRRGPYEATSLRGGVTSERGQDLRTNDFLFP